MQFFEGLSPKIWHSISIHRVHIKQFSINTKTGGKFEFKVFFQVCSYILKTETIPPGALA
jgi:hypothetical protein